MSKEIPLSGSHADGLKVVVDDIDYPLLSRQVWHYTIRGPARSVGKSGTRLFMRQLVYGSSEGKHIWHKNGNQLDCRRSNLTTKA